MIRRQNEGCRIKIPKSCHWTTCLYLQWCQMNYLSGDLCCAELLWHVGSSMAGCLAPRQLISPCYQLHPKAGLIPEVEGKDSLHKSEPTEACGLPANNLRQHCAMYTGDSNTTLQFWLRQCLIWYVSSQVKTCSVWIRQMQVAAFHLCPFFMLFFTITWG